MPETLEETKARLRLVDFDEPVFEMDRDELREHFSFKNGELHTSRMIKNLIWDDHKRILSGELDPFVGNIRSYWYARVKPALDRAGARKFERKYPMMINQFVALIVTERLFDYKDFGFADAGARHRRLGRFNPHLVIVAEKIGLYPLLEEMAADFEFTIVALGGHPSAMATEYFVDVLVEAGLQGEELHLLTCVDYDPAGASIARTFRWQLQRLGFEGTLTRLDLMHPSQLSREQILLNRFSLTNNTRTRKRNTAWANKTGGLSDFGGRKFEGLEVDAMPWPQIRDLVERQVTPLLRVSKEQVIRRRTLEELVDVMRGLLDKRLFG